MGAQDIGIDLGTTKIIIFSSVNGEILREPAVVAYDLKDDSIVAFGEEALKMVGKTPNNIIAEYPLRDGVISDYKLTQVLIKECIKKACNSFLVKQRVIACIPSSITDVERRTVVEVIANAGGRKIYLIDEPIAAAIGAGLDITKPEGLMVIDIGGGTSDIAVISMMGIVVSTSLKYAGNRIDDNIVKLIATRYKISIGKRMAETIKKNVANLFNPTSTISVSVKGRDLITGYPRQIEISESEIHECILSFGESLVESIKNVLEDTPPELAGDIYNTGIMITGGGALINGLSQYIKQEINVNTIIAQNPIECVSIGTGRAFKYIEQFESGFSTESTYKY